MKHASKLVGPALVAAGAWLLYTGYNLSQSVSSQFKEAFSGKPADEVMIYYVGGAAAVIIGLGFAGFGFGSKKS